MRVLHRDNKFQRKYISYPNSINVLFIISFKDLLEKNLDNNPIYRKYACLKVIN